MRERQPSLLDEDTPGIREFHKPSFIASEQVKSMFCFEVGNLFAERRLGDVQSIRGPREVPLFGQNNDCVQVTDFEVGEHRSNLSLPNRGDWLRLHLVKEPEAKKKY
jgi:hypothetical protein